VIIGVAAGVAAGGLGWWLAGGPARPGEALDAPEARLARLKIPRARGDAAAAPDVAVLAATPLFILTTGPGATPAPVLRLDGVSKSRSRTAALLSIDDQPADWLAVGDRRGGVVLQAVSAGKAVVDTVYGPVEVALGERVGGAPAGTPVAATGAAQPAPQPAVAPQGLVQPTIVDAPPPGFRSPPPPASAPDLRR